MNNVETTVLVDLEDIPHPAIFKEAISRLEVSKQSFAEMAKKMDISKKASYIAYLGYIKQLKKIIDG